MSKRKYVDFRQGQDSPSPVVRSRKFGSTHVDHHLEHGKRRIFHQLRLARGFERQKLGRRQKTARAEQSDSNISRIEAEIAALKNLDLQKVAEIHLFKILLKSNSTISVPNLNEKIRNTIETDRQPPNRASTNVQARLFKSSLVAAATTETLSDIRRELGLEAIELGAGKRLRTKDFMKANGQHSHDILPAEEAKQRNREDGYSNESETASTIHDEHEEDASWDGFSDYDTQDAIAQASQSNDESEDFSQYASRLAGSSEEDYSLGDSESEEGKISVTRAASSTEEGSSDAGTRPRARTKKKRASTAAPKTTTFLPSLASGGYWSGSESASDDGAEKAAKIEIRKNRRGQQARRALWEKKFGKNANHVKKQEQSRDHGWDLRRGASGGDDSRQRGRGRGGNFRSKLNYSRSKRGGDVDEQSKFRSGANNDPLGQKKKPKTNADAPLHPSWEAAKKAKEQRKPVSFQGKKVVFN